MISIIVAIAENGVIGKDNLLPWHYPDDLKYFKKQTLGKKVVMGSKTFYSIIDTLGKPLPNRKSIVVTRNKSFSYPGVEVVNDITKYLSEVNEDIFIIGGKQIYQQALPFADKLYITHIAKAYIGDTYFPPINFDEYNKVFEEKHDELSFCIYERVKR